MADDNITPAGDGEAALEEAWLMAKLAPRLQRAAVMRRVR